MSVIFGTFEADKITVVADNRETYPDGTYNDNSQKLYVIHEQLCIAMAGSDAISKAINLNIDNYKTKTRDKITTDDITNIITSFYNSVLTLSPNILKYPFVCIYAGIGNDDKPYLISGTKCKEGYICKSVPQIIFAPADMDKSECDGILLNNYFIDRGDYPKNILNAISEKSKYVSSCGDKWVFDLSTQKGVLYQI